MTTTPAALHEARRPIGRAVAVLVLALAALVAAAVPASAHASVDATTPFDTQRLEPDEVPDAVTIEFNERVTVPPDAIRVFDDDGQRVDVEGAVEGIGGPFLAGRALGELDDGAYIVTWAVVSEDGHPIRGAFVFTVGTAAGPSDAQVAEVFGGGAGAVGPAQVAATWVTYVAVLLAVGAVLSARVLRRRDSDELARWVRTATLVAVVTTVLIVPLQAAAASGDGLGAAVDPAQLADVLAGSVGLAALVRLAGLAGMLWTRGGPRVAAAVVALLSFLVDGHTRTVDPVWLIVTADAVHLLAGAIWFGGLVALLQRLRAHRLADDPVGGARSLRAWSRLATVAVAGVVVAGSALSYTTVRDPLAIVTTDYGVILQVKLVLALLVIGLGAYNHFKVVPAVERAVVLVPAGAAVSTSTPALPDDPRDGGPPATVRTEAGWQRLGATVRLEVVLLVAVLAVTGWLQGQRPAAEELGIGGTFLASEELGEGLTLDVIVDPNVAGQNSIHLYLLDETGRPVSDVEGVTLSLSLPERDIGPIEREAPVAGPGHWTLTGGELGLPGTWQIEARVRIDQFTERAVTVRSVVAAP